MDVIPTGRLNALRALPARLSNQVQQVRHPDIKIFVIGFNRCGTRSLHMLFRKSGIRSAHWRGFDPSRNLAAIMARNVDQNSNILQGLETYTAFLDISYHSFELCIEGCRFFKHMHAQYPNSYFVYNTRPVEHWVQSRLRHRHGDLIRRVVSAYGCRIQDLPERWTSEYEAHRRDVLSFFLDKPDKLCVLDIENDNITKLIGFLRPHFRIAECYWEHLGKSNEG